MKLIIRIIIILVYIIGIVCILLAGQARADDTEQYICPEHGFVDTENITFHGLDFPVCSICLEKIVQNNSNTFARLVEEAWKGTNKEVE